MTKKVTKLALALLLSISSLGIIGNNAKATENPERLTNQEELELAKIIEKHVYADQNHYLYIDDEAQLSESLNNSTLNLSVSDIKDLTEDFNSKLSGEQGEEIQNELLNSIQNFEENMDNYLNNDNGNTAFRSTAKTVCSAAMTGVGISNAAIMTAGGVALGAAGPAGWAALATSAMWGAGSVAACN